MSAVAESTAVEQPRYVKRRGGAKAVWERRRIELVLLGVAFAAYFALGAWLTLEAHVVYGDAESRLAHAYFVWWNEPRKLAAVGFVWPPIMTSAFVPLALVKPLATSLLALPFFSALVGGALLFTVSRTLGYLGMPPRERVVLAVLFGMNPIVVAYATNGMSEIASMWFLALTVEAFVRWYHERLSRELVVAALFLAAGALVRYETALLAIVLVPAIVAMVPRGEGRRVEVEANVVSLVAPLAYALAVWSFLNWTIIGHPLSWLQEETAQTFQQTRESAARFGDPTHISLGRAAGTILGLDVRVFPLIFVVAAALVALAVHRRGGDPLAPTLAGAMLLNAATSIFLTVWKQTPHIFELRFNIHALPIAMIGIGWIYSSLATRRARAAVWAAAAAALAATLPLTWHTMSTYRYQLNEHAFVNAVSTGRDQNDSIVSLDPRADLRMARFIKQHVKRRNSILADDAQTFGVILRTGRPDLFVDRVDHGDNRWLQIAETPFRTVPYVLVSNLGGDLVARLHPRAFGGAASGLRLVYATRTSHLYRVVGPVGG